MFNLEKSIAEWRRQMLAAGLKTPAPLEELEVHLREEIEQQINSGASPPRAFQAAVEKLGQARELKKEFNRAGVPWENRLVELMGAGCGAIAFLFSLWIFPFLFIHHAGWIEILLGAAAVAAIILSWKYNHRLLPCISNPIARAAIGFAAFLGGLFWIGLFIVNFLPGLLIRAAGDEMPESRVLVLFLWAWALMAMLAGLGRGAGEVRPRSKSHK